MHPKVSVRNLEEADLERVAAIHALAFSESALTRLGPEVVRRYYRWQMTGPHDCLAVGAFADQELVGFCFGGVFRGALSGFVRENRWFLISRISRHPHLLADPLFRTRLSRGVHSLGYALRRSRRPKAPPQRSRRSFGILSIAVDPGCQGKGVGRRLMRAAEDEARRGSFEMMHLTVHPGNIQAVRFYERLGWEKVMKEKVWEGSMRKDLKVKQKA